MDSTVDDLIMSEKSMTLHSFGERAYQWKQEFFGSSLLVILMVIVW